MTDTISFKFSDLDELARKLAAFSNKGEIWSDQEYELTLTNNILGDGSITRDFKITEIDAGEPVALTFKNAAQFKAANGVMFTVRIVRKCDRYGRNHCLTHDSDDTLIEFYDARYPHTEYGQFVSRYYYRTLIGDEYGGSVIVNGLCLDGGVPSWQIDANTMGAIMAWLKSNV